MGIPEGSWTDPSSQLISGTDPSWCGDPKGIMDGSELPAHPWNRSLTLAPVDEKLSPRTSSATVRIYKPLQSPPGPRITSGLSFLKPLWGGTKNPSRRAKQGGTELPTLLLWGSHSRPCCGQKGAGSTPGAKIPWDCSECFDSLTGQMI